MALPGEALAAVKAHLRVFGSEEDALIAGALEAAAQLCEQFIGQALIVRAHEEVLEAASGWRRLGASPVRSIGTVQGWDPQAGGAGPMLPAEDYAIDIDADGRGWIKVSAGAARRVRVSYQAGLATGWDEVPEALRQGILRLAGHLHAEREGGDKAPPASVAALWRPWRQMNLGQRHVRAG